MGVLNGLDLFSGIGGITLALNEWVKPVAYCENDRYAQSVLLSRMSSGELFQAPIWDDVRTLTGKLIPPVDMVYGGFPCQDISVAGNGAGLEGERSRLFFELVRLVKETCAPWVFVENVPAIRTRGLKEVVGAFTDLGYNCRWTCVSAAEVGAWHLRKRWFLLAHSDSIRGGEQHGWSSGADREGAAKFRDDGKEKLMADADLPGCEEQWRAGSTNKEKLFAAERSSWWESEPSMGRVVHGLQFRVDRIKALGNAVVPLQARTAFKRLIGY